MILALCMVLTSSLGSGLRARLVVEESGRQMAYVVDFGPGALRVEPEGSGVYLLVDVGAKTVTLVRVEEKSFTRLDPGKIRRFMRTGIVSPSWFPWVYPVSADLVTSLTVRALPGKRLPDGREGSHVGAYSETYDRLLAEYWVDPKRPGGLFFQWRKVYLDLWGEDAPEADRAQEERLGIYDQLDGLPLRMEERFTFLTRSRVLRMESLEASPAGVFAVRIDFKEKTPNQVLLESLLRRLERWLAPKDRLMR